MNIKDKKSFDATSLGRRVRDCSPTHSSLVAIKTLSTTEARARMSDLVNIVSNSNKSIVIGRRNTPQVVLIPFPAFWNNRLSEITNINAYSKSFNFLENEPEIYSVNDVKKKYA